MKTLVHCYKHSDWWQNSPPGLGDFIRGCCHLYELAETHSLGFKIDLSKSGFSKFLDSDPILIVDGDEIEVRQAREFFVNHSSLREEISLFLSDTREALYVSTNLGQWDRITLPLMTKDFMRRVLRFDLRFARDVQNQVAATDYNVLSVRCGDNFYDQPHSIPPPEYLGVVVKLIESHILGVANAPVVVTSDSFALKKWLAQRFNFHILPHRSEHGAFNINIGPVATDMCLLSMSKMNFHINLWASWWSGFSHYTSLIFDIPSLNFRAPNFSPEFVNISHG